MADTPIPPLDYQTPIVLPSGVPSPQFIRLWQNMFGNVADQAGGLAGKADKSTEIIAGTGLSGGGDLSANRTISLDASIGDLNDVDLSTPPTDQQVLVYDDVTSQWVPADQSGGGGSTTPKPVAPFLAAFPNSANTPIVASADGLGISLSGATASSQLRYIYKTLPAVDDTFILGIRPILRGNYNAIGLIYRDSTSGKSITAGTSYNGGDLYEYTLWNSDTSSNTSTGGGSKPSQIPMFVKVDYIAATHSFTISYSLDMLVWFSSGTNTSWLSAPDQVGLCYRSFSTSTQGWGTILYYKDAAGEFDYSGYVVYG